MMIKPIAIVTSIIYLTGCSPQYSKVYKKQRSESDIKISYLNLETGLLKTHFQYHSYVDKILENIECDVEMNSQVSFNLSKPINIQLGAFSKESIEFQVNQIQLDPNLIKKESIEYKLNCQIIYNKGEEYLRESSMLYLNPGHKFIYR